MDIVSGSTLISTRGGATSKKETILPEAATSPGKAMQGLVLKDVLCIKGAKGKGQAKSTGECS